MAALYSMSHNLILLTWELLSWTVIRCTIYTVHVVQSRLIHSQDNSIEMVAPLKVNAKLIFVNLSYNCLPMIHGLDGCTNIRYLDLSHNRITRIGRFILSALFTMKLCYSWKTSILYFCNILVKNYVSHL